MGLDMDQDMCSRVQMGVFPYCSQDVSEVVSTVLTLERLASAIALMLFDFHVFDRNHYEHKLLLVCGIGFECF